jgi:serine/threonine protein phosphatase PrpC
MLGWLTSSSNTSYRQQNWKAALHSAFVDGDAELLAANPDEPSGCTANAVMLVGSTLLCANAGDSRAVLCRGGVAFALSEDHKPTDAGEKARIDRAGGFVLNGRVNGVLSLSRAIGDVSFKQRDVAPELQAVTPCPDVLEVQMQLDDEFVVQACDGIWDCVTNEQAVMFVRNELSEHGDVSLACENLIEKCLAPLPAKYGTDNMTVIITSFKSSYLSKVLTMPQQAAATAAVDHGNGEEEET